MTVADKIREMRKKAGLTQTQLAQKMGVTQGTITQYENGRRFPKLDTLTRIADAIGCDVLSLVTIEENGTHVIDLTTANVSPKDISKLLDARNDPSPNRKKDRLCRTFDLLNESGRDKLTSYAEDLLKIPQYRKK